MDFKTHHYFMLLKTEKHCQLNYAMPLIFLGHILNSEMLKREKQWALESVRLVMSWCSNEEKILQVLFWSLRYCSSNKYESHLLFCEWHYFSKASNFVVCQQIETCLLFSRAVFLYWLKN